MDPLVRSLEVEVVYRRLQLRNFNFRGTDVGMSLGLKPQARNFKVPVCARWQRTHRSIGTLKLESVSRMGTARSAEEVEEQEEEEYKGGRKATQPHRYPHVHTATLSPAISSGPGTPLVVVGVGRQARVAGKGR